MIISNKTNIINIKVNFIIFLLFHNNMDPDFKHCCVALRIVNLLALCRDCHGKKTAYEIK